MKVITYPIYLEKSYSWAKVDFYVYLNNIRCKIKKVKNTKPTYLSRSSYDLKNLKYNDFKKFKLKEACTSETTY